LLFGDVQVFVRFKLGSCSGVLVLSIFVLNACASAGSDRPFTLIKPQEAWVQMKAPPTESAAIIEAAGDSTKEMLADKKKFQVTWFTRKTDDYLIYFQVRDNGDSACGDEAPEFYKDEDGRWIEDRLSRISMCKQ
jgi:hypothetical protein